MQFANKDIQKIKIDFDKLKINFKNIPEDPFILFNKWFNDVLKLDKIQSISCVLSTSNDNFPSSRVVFLKEINNSGFIFYTNYNSKKGKDISKNPNVCLNFNWSILQRQVRIVGIAKKTTKKKSENYFKIRSRDSQLGALASTQSDKIYMEINYNSIIQDLDKKFRNSTVKIPKYWGGYVIQPLEIEFWQGRPNRLHDRLKYHKLKRKWSKTRLAP